MWGWGRKTTKFFLLIFATEIGCRDIIFLSIKTDESISYEEIL